MLDVFIRENNGLVADCKIFDEPYEMFRAYVLLLKSIPVEDREYDDVTHVWTIKNAEKYADVIEEIGTAIEIHKRQLSMF